MCDLGWSQSLRDGCYLPERKSTRLTVGPRHDERQLLQICGTLSRFRRETHIHFTRLVAWVDPVSRLDASERGTQCLRNLTNGHANRPGKSTIQLDVELGLLALRRQSHVHRPFHLPHLLGDCFGGATELLR